MFFTIFTPTFNRAHTLHRVFDSLKQQTIQDFEWLIVDAGSTDDTQKLVETFAKEATFPIRYFFQENQGKHIAINRGVAQAKGDFFLIHDSDDACVPESLAIFKKYWAAIPSAQQPHFCGIASRCQYQNGTPVGKKTLPNNGILDVSTLDLSYRYGINYEMWRLFRTDILRGYPFPEHIKKATVPEGLIWTKIGERYKTRFVNDFLRIYFVEDGHESLINVKTPMSQRNLQGSLLYYRQVLNAHITYFLHAPLIISTACVHFIRFSLKEKISLIEQVSSLTTVFGRLLFLVFFPIGFLFFLKDKKH